SKAPRPPPPSRTPRSGARPARRRSPCRRRAWWRPCARCWRGTEVDADGKGGTYTIAPVGARVAIVQSVGLFDDGQALIEHVLYPGFEMRKTTHQLALHHELEIVPKGRDSCVHATDPGIDTIDARVDTVDPRVQVLLHPSREIRSLQRQCTDIGYLAPESLGLGQILPHELGKQSKV